MVSALRLRSLARSILHPSPGAVGPASRPKKGRRYADAPAAALLTGLGVAVGPACRLRRCFAHAPAAAFFLFGFLRGSTPRARKASKHCPPHPHVSPRGAPRAEPRRPVFGASLPLLPPVSPTGRGAAAAAPKAKRQDMAPKFFEFEGKRVLWRDLVKLRRAQLQAAAKAAQPALFELKEDCRPASERTASGRFQEPSLFRITRRPSGSFTRPALLTET